VILGAEEIVQVVEAIPVQPNQIYTAPVLMLTVGAPTATVLE
jgi:hypothetical protein